MVGGASESLTRANYDEREYLLDLTAVARVEDLNRFEPFFFLNHYRFE